MIVSFNLETDWFKSGILIKTFLEILLINIESVTDMDNNNKNGNNQTEL